MTNTEVFNDNDSFDMAFASAISEEPPKIEEPVQAAEPKIEEPAQQAAESKIKEPAQQVVEPVQATKPKIEEPAQQAAESKIKEPDQQVVEPVEPKLDAKTIAEETAKKIAEKTAAEEAIKKKATEEAAKKKAAEDAAALRLTAEKPSKEEQALLADVTENFPEVAKALNVVERIVTAKISNLLDNKLSEMIGQLNSQLAPVFATTQTMANNQHEAVILGKHADAFTIIPEVEKWVEKQPSLLKSTYNGILDNGSADQVVQLLDLYKESIKQTQKSVDNEQKKAAEKEKEDKLLAQEGVRGRQASSQTAIDPNDFNGAFSHYAKQ